MPPKRGRPPKAEAVKREDATPATSTRRKRGAPTTVDDERENTSKRAKVTVADESKLTNDPPPKRGRGRPPKSSKEESGTSTNASATTAKRGRGRPPKSIDHGDQSSSNNGTQVVKRGRGRPARGGSAKNTVEPVKRKPGRPAKSVSNVKSEVPQTIGGHQKHPKNHRNKAAYTPKQLPLGEQTHQEEANDQLLTETMEATTVPAGGNKKRGRPKSNAFTETLAAEMENEKEVAPKAKRTKTAEQPGVPTKKSDASKGTKRQKDASSSKQETTTSAKQGRDRPRTTTTTKGAKEEKKQKSTIPLDLGSAVANALDDKCIDEHGRHLWLLKAEPESRIENGKDVKFSIDDLAACTEPEPWSGVRNPVARNNMKAMKVGDLGLFYHSNAKKLTGVVGIMEIVGEATPDLTAFDKNDPYYDEKSDKSKPKWFNVHVQFRQKLPRLVPLTELKAEPDLQEMMVLKQSRLSVTKVTKSEWDTILRMAAAEGVPPGPNRASMADAKAPVSAASTMAAAVKGATHAVSDKISAATATAAAAMSAAFKDTTGNADESNGGLDISDTLPTRR